MSARLLSIAAAAVLVLCTGCSGDDEPAAGNSGQEPAAPVAKYTKFGDFPGPELSFNDGNPVGSRMKAVDTQWTPELASVPAEAGRHYLAVYVAVTPELDDRGVPDVTLRGPILRAKKSADDCKPGAVESYQNCTYPAYPTTQLEEVADGEWRDQEWQDVEIGGTDLERGQTGIGVLAFSVPDDVDAPGGFELCAPTKDTYSFEPDYPCVGIPTPKEPRN
jgi:hypothetical protein